MKNILVNLLRTGFSTSKKSIDEICKGYWELKQLFIQENGFIRCASNKFWSYENNQNRLNLIHIIARTKRATITDGWHFTYLNNMANGNKFGMEIKNNE